MPNPLLEQHPLPPFSRIEPAHAEPAVRELIERNKQAIEALLEENQTYTWDNLLAPIEQLEDELAQAFSPVSHLNSVCNSEAMREAYNACLPLLSEYGTWMGQHTRLCEAYQQIADSPDFEHMDDARRKAVENALRDFRLAGVSLPPEEKARYGELRKRLSELGSKFGENVLDATNAWSRRANREELQGLPDTALANARQAARRAGYEDYLINLEFPSWSPVLTYCENRELREEVYTANCTRASEVGPHAGRWDNAGIIEETLDLRRQLAELLLEQLAQQSREQSLREWHELENFAREQHGVESLAAWDVTFYSEKLRQQRYQVSQEDIRPYLPVSRVLPGLFEVVSRLYELEIREVQDFEHYHCDAQLFEIRQDDQLIARFFLDLYARADKRGGAWMDDCRVRRLRGGELQIPVAYLVCNFTPPVEGKPALLTHTELTTLFHEFGHGLHHMLTRQTVAAVSGINGVAWDAVELPSQFLENWCWEREALTFISGHHETGDAGTATGILIVRLPATQGVGRGGHRISAVAAG
jgi:oligopeptidase A